VLVTSPTDLFTYADSVLDVDDAVAASHRSVWDQIGHSGTWWSPEQMLAIAARARAVFRVRLQPPWARHVDRADDGLSDDAVIAIDGIASNPGSIDGEWASARISELGDGPYVELIGVVATTVMVDMFADCAGVDLAPLPGPALDPGRPTQTRPDGLGDIGAHVPMIDPFDFANVARALSLVPSANMLFRTTVGPMYSAPGMSNLVWNTPLQRPQVELVASRVASMNECFY
jgi:hypothetical protein